MDWDLICIIFVIWCCWIWSGIIADEIMNTLLRTIENSNKEKEMLFAFYVTQKHCPQNFFLVQPTRRVVLKRKVDPAQVSHFTEDTVAQRKQKPLII